MIAADIIDDTDLLYPGCGVPPPPPPLHQEQLDTCPSFPDLTDQHSLHRHTASPAMTQNWDFVRVVQLFLDDALSQQIFPVDDTLRIREIITRKQ